MILGIMQPYIFPYIGYFQLINAVDNFVIYDDIEYTKKGWINRNRILMNGTDLLFTLPIKKDSDFLSVMERILADTFPDYRKKLKGQLMSAYSRSPHFKTVYPVIESCLDYEDINLFNYIFNAIQRVCNYLDITTNFITSSSLNRDAKLKGEDKVLDINKALQASTYINASGGQALYSKDLFLNEGINLQFIQTGEIVYPQFNHAFVPHLSIIDVMMFNSKEQIQGCLAEKYTLI